MNDPFELPSLEEIKEMEKAAIASIRIIAGIRLLSYEQEFINVAAHELRTPIQPIISLSDVLLQQIKGQRTKV